MLDDDVRCIGSNILQMNIGSSGSESCYWNKSSINFSTGFATVNDTINSYFRNHSNKSPCTYKYGLISNNSNPYSSSSKFYRQLTKALGSTIRGTNLHPKAAQVLERRIDFRNKAGAIIELDLCELFSMYLKTETNLQAILTSRQHTSMVIKPFLGICQKLANETIRLRCDDIDGAVQDFFKRCKETKGPTHDFHVTQGLPHRTKNSCLPHTEYKFSTEEYQELMGSKIGSKAIEEAERLMAIWEEHDLNKVKENDDTGEPLHRIDTDRKGRKGNYELREEGTQYDSILCRELKSFIEKTDKILSTG